MGYNIYRSTVKRTIGEKLNIMSAFGGTYVDVNAKPGTTYYYTVREIIGGSAAAGQTGSGDRSIAGDTQTEATTGEISGDVGNQRGFILMQIGKDTMSVNGALVEIDPGRGAAPILENGRTLLPIRAVIEAMGGSAEWDAGEQKILLSVLSHTLEMWVGRRDMTVDGSAAAMDIAPEIINGRTMLPLRFVAENTGCLIEWIGSTQEIVIVYPL
jgi:hypothetical protein